jgi:hypothetical protein
VTGYSCDYPLAVFGGEEHQFLLRLRGLGCVLWVGEPGWPGRGEFTRPVGWQNLARNGNETRIATFDETRHCICVNTGDPLAVVDVDPRNRGDIEKVRALLLDELKVRIYAEVDTPSGGVHFYIVGHPDLPSVHSTVDNGRLPGFPGVDIQSFGCNVYAPGTRRPKYDGAGYTIVFDDLDMADDDLDGAEALAAWVAENLAQAAEAAGRKAKSGAREWNWEPCEPWSGARPDARQQAYLDAVLTGESKKVAAAPEGERSWTLYVAALKCATYVAGAGLDEQKVRDALEDAADKCGLADDDGDEGRPRHHCVGLPVRAQSPAGGAGQPTFAGAPWSGPDGLPGRRTLRRPTAVRDRPGMAPMGRHPLGARRSWRGPTRGARRATPGAGRKP